MPASKFFFFFCGAPLIVVVDLFVYWSGEGVLSAHSCIAVEPTTQSRTFVNSQYCSTVVVVVYNLLVRRDNLL